MRESTIKQYKYYNSHKISVIQIKYSRIEYSHYGALVNNAFLKEVRNFLKGTGFWVDFSKLRCGTQKTLMDCQKIKELCLFKQINFNLNERFVNKRYETSKKNKICVIEDNDYLIKTNINGIQICSPHNFRLFKEIKPIKNKISCSFIL